MANPRSYLHCIKNEDVNHLVLLLDGQSDLSLTQHPLGFPLKRLRMPQLLVKVKAYYDFEDVIDSDEELDLASMATEQ
ncbi:hypothetical protein CSA_023378 [Cucumis sativus]|nr:hypothetical protein CSA_023378 [Cucumis sativus]